MSKKNKSNFRCPFIGAEPAPAKDGGVTVIAVVGHSSGAGCPADGGQSVQAKQPKTAQERIEALRKAGVDVSNLFAMQGSNGGEHIASNKNGVLVILEESDPIFNQIIDQGTVPNRSLFRRWVMAQMFHMMSYTPYGQREPIGVTGMIHRLGYEYQWKMVMNELYAQMKMEGRDPENFANRNRWFNVGVVTAMAVGYIEALKKRVDTLPTKRCKCIPYKRVGGRDIFVEDLQNKLYAPLQMAMRRIPRARNAAQLYKETKVFNEMRLKMAWETPQSKEWVDAYKGSGAFFTMQNLIRFHNCVLSDDMGRRMDKHRSLAFLSVRAEDYKVGEGWRLLALLKKMLADNNIDIKRKMAQWRRRK